MGHQLIYLCICIFRGKARVQLHNLLGHENGRTCAATVAPLEPAFPEPASQPAPYPTVDQELESQHAPDPAADIEALAGQNHSLKRKLREAVQVANGCHQALESKRAEAAEIERKLR